MNTTGTDSKQFILAIDQSTTSTKVMLFDREARLLQRVNKPHKQHYPQTGFVEHDPVEIFQNLIEAVDELLEQSGVRVESIAVLAITNQRETAMIWDRTTGLPIHNAIVWQCQRGAPFCDQLKSGGHETLIREKTGLVIDPYFSASKLRWIMNHVEGAKARAANGELMLGTMDSWLLWNLTGKRVHATDQSNACRTMLYNIHDLKWDEELAGMFDLEMNMFPEVKYSDEVFGYTDPDVILGSEIPVSGLIGDSHGALFGQQCFEAGVGKVTYGTGSSVMMNIGKKPLDPPAGLVTSIGFGRNGEIDYVFEGNIHCTGDTINWLQNELQLIKDASETEALARSVDCNQGVYLVPAFVGLGAPYWDNHAKACIVGMSRDSSKAHIVRAALESIAYQVKDLVDLMVSAPSVKLSSLRVDGGPTKNEFLMQFQSDILPGTIVRQSIEEVSALGATLMAGLAVGFWSGMDEIAGLQNPDRTFNPSMPGEKVESLYGGWISAVAKSRHNNPKSSQ